MLSLYFSLTCFGCSAKTADHHRALMIFQSNRTLLYTYSHAHEVLKHFYSEKGKKLIHWTTKYLFSCIWIFFILPPQTNNLPQNDRCSPNLLHTFRHLFHSLSVGAESNSQRNLILSATCHMPQFMWQHSMGNWSKLNKHESAVNNKLFAPKCMQPSEALCLPQHTRASYCSKFISMLQQLFAADFYAFLPNLIQQRKLHVKQIWRWKVWKNIYVQRRLRSKVRSRNNCCFPL